MSARKLTLYRVEWGFPVYVLAASEAEAKQRRWAEQETRCCWPMLGSVSVATEQDARAEGWLSSIPYGNASDSKTGTGPYGTIREWFRKWGANADNWEHWIAKR